jgi:hypothetical protein
MSTVLVLLNSFNNKIFNRIYFVFPLISALCCFASFIKNDANFIATGAYFALLLASIIVSIRYLTLKKLDIFSMLGLITLAYLSIFLLIASLIMIPDVIGYPAAGLGILLLALTLFIRIYNGKRHTP